jgi:ATP-dependent Clp protease ATP-binding subunit ClpC
VKDILVNEGYDVNMGARPLRRAVQRFIEDPLSEEFLMGNFAAGDHVLATVDPEDPKKVIFKKDKPDSGGKKKKELVKN